MTEEHKKKISLANKGKPKSKEHRKKLSLARMGKSPSNKGKKCSDEHRKKISETMMGRPSNAKGKTWTLSTEIRKRYSRIKKGKKNHLWKGGITPINKAIRNSLEYRLWREAVFKRDKYTCVWCGIKESPLNADHIKSFAEYPELRFAIDNGRTLCVPCHKTTDSYLNKKVKFKS